MADEALDHSESTQHQMERNDLFKITLFFLLIKFIQFALVFCVQNQFDKSSSSLQITVTSSSILGNVLQKLIVWDNVYFYKLFYNGAQYEHEWVFGPLWWRIVQIIGNYFDVDNFLLATIISNLLNYLSSLLLFQITQSYFIADPKCHEISIKSSLMFILSPAGIFSSIPYSENLCTFCTFIGLYLRQSSLSSSLDSVKKIQRPMSYLSSSIFFGLAFLTRSNSIVTGFLFLYDLFTIRSILSLISGMILGTSILLLNYFPYAEFCPERGEWCNALFPSLFTFAQSHYWNVGFLKYWSPNNLFNFIIAMPMVLLLLKSSFYFYKRFSSLSVLTIIYLLVIVGFVHVQIVNRISSFIPLPFWYLACQLCHRGGNGADLWILWLLVWIPLQTVLFASFLPPA